MLLKHELEGLLGAPIYALECRAQIEAIYITVQPEHGYEYIYQTGWINTETYKFCTDEYAKIPLEFRIDAQTVYKDRVEYVITRAKRERFEKYKFCYRRNR